MGSVSRYNIRKDQWEQGTPDLIVERMYAAACTLGDSVFVFAGMDTGFQRATSVERINVPEIASGVATW